MAQKTTFDEHISPRSKISYSFANMANGLLAGLGEGQINYFYAEKYMLDPALIGLAWLIFAAWNAINDPLFGIIEEKTKSGLGRRVPYLRYGSLIYGPLFVLIWFPFAQPGNQMSLFINLIAMLFLFDTIYSMIGLVTYSLPAEMAITSKERGSIMIYSNLIGFVGQLFSFLLPILFLQGSKSIFIWQMIMVATAVACVIIMYISSYWIKENKWTQKEETLGFIDSIKETFKNKPFLVLEVAIFVMTITQTLLTSNLLFLIQYVIVVHSSIEYLYLGPVFIVLFASIFIMQKFIKKIGIKKTFIYGSVIGAIGFGILPLMGHDLGTICISLTLVVIGLAAMLMTNQPLMADVIDYDEVLTKKRRETTYSGVNALITKPAVSIANWLFFYIIALYGYNKQLPIQPASVGNGVVLAFSIVPVVSVIIMVIAMFFFKLDGPEWEKQKMKLQEIHAQKELDYIESLKEEGKLINETKNDTVSKKKEK